MPVTMDNSNYEVLRLEITGGPLRSGNAEATITAHLPTASERSVLSYSVTGSGIPDPTQSTLAQGGTLTVSEPFGKTVRSVAFDAAHTPAVLGKLGLPGDLAAEVSLRFDAADHKASIGVTSREVGAQAVVFTQAMASHMLKALCQPELMPGALMKEVHKAYPEQVVALHEMGGQVAVRISADAVSVPGGIVELALSSNRQTGLAMIAACAAGTSDAAAAENAVLHHLQAHGMAAERGPAGEITLPRGIDHTQALQALAAPGEHGQPPLIPREIAEHAGALSTQLRPSPVFGAVGRVAGAAMRAMAPLTLLKDAIGERSLALATEIPLGSLSPMEQALAQAKAAQPSTSIQLAEAQETGMARAPKAPSSGRGIA